MWGVFEAAVAGTMGFKSDEVNSSLWLLWSEVVHNFKL
jgi:hypothetical protein